MKKIIITTLLLGVLIFNANAQVTVSGAAGITDGTSYSTLKLAFDAINAQAQTASNNILIAISGNTTETATAALNAGGWNSLTIYPTAENYTISGTVQLINFNGADNVTIDGRVNRSGSARSLTLSNSGNYNTINFTSVAQNNTIKYCNVFGSQTTSTRGIFAFGETGSDNNANGLNTIDNNLISNNGTRPIYAIYSNGGPTGYPTTGNRITNNEFKDCLNTGASSIIIAINSANAGNTGWTIKGNKFYDTATSNSYTGGNTILNILSGTDYDISDNVIGGSASDNSGTWTKDNTANSSFTGIALSSSNSSGTNMIKNNTIKNFSWSNSGNGAWTAILVGSASIATIDGNNVGNNTSTGSITTSNGAINGVVTGISITSTSAVDCINNRIGSITANSVSTYYAVAINAINKGTQAGNTNISNNIIGSSTVSNSIYSTTNIASQNVKGIVCTGTGTNTISNNEIGSLTTGSTSGFVNAIDLGAGTNAVNANLIYNLASPNSTSTTLNGINLAASGTNTCTNNIISLGNNYANTINGINEAASTTANNYYYNTIYISGAPTSAALNSIGINSLSAANNRNIKNNLIFNNRVNGTGATGKNYAISLATKTGGTLVCDYNNLFVSADATYNFVGKYGSTNKQLLSNWQNTISSNDVFSISSNPNFVNTNYTSAGYKTTSASNGNTEASVTTDFAGGTRYSTPQMGAWEMYSTWNGSVWDVSPSSSLNAIINGNYSGAGFDCLDLTVNAGKQFSLTSGTLTVNGNLTLKSDAANGTATFIDNGGTFSVGANKTFVEQYLTSGRNWYISSPVSAATSNVFAASSTKPMYYYVETSPNIWSQITNTSTTLDAKKGYIANINTDRVVSFNGGSLNSGTQTISDLTRGGASFTGFNLVGNPYPSYLNWSTTTKTNVSTSIWYRSKSTGSYLFQTYNVAGAGIGTNGGTNLIPPMQAFWVRVTSGTGSIGLTINDRDHLDQSVSTNRLKSPKVDERTIVRLQVSNGINTDETVIYTDAEASNNIDQFDSNKMFNNNTAVPEIYTVLGSEKLAINGYNTISPNQEIAVGFKTTSANSFTIKASELKNLNSDTKVILVDKSQGNTEFDLSAGESYSFTSDITDTNTRFSIIYKSAGTTTDIASQSSPNTKVYVNANKQVVIESDIATNYSIYNALGQKIRSGNLNTNQAIVSDLMAGQFYIVKSGNTVQRVIIN